MQQEKGFFASLFDLEFSELVTPRIIRVVFIIGLVFIAFGSLMWLFGMTAGMMPGGMVVFGLILSALFFVVGVVALRIWLEVIMVVFRIADDLRAIRTSGQGRLTTDRP